MSAHLDQPCIDTLRSLLVDGAQHVSSGLPGLPLGTLPVAHALWSASSKHHSTKPRAALRLSASASAPQIDAVSIGEVAR